MGAPDPNVCATWALPEEVSVCACADVVFPAGTLEGAVLVATDILYRLSGHQWPGTCTRVVRPCRRPASIERLSRFFDDWNGTWNQSWGACSCNRHPERGDCGCSPLSEITLGGYPITDITEVWVDGVLLDPSQYRVDDYRWLVRTDGEPWPCCQDLLADPLTEENTFQVEFEYGINPPYGGGAAAITLACELALACIGSTKCRLPQRVQTITRQGVSMALLDPFEFMNNGRTGLYEVDLWLASVNPHKIQHGAQIVSPDIKRPVRQVGT